MPLLHIFHIQNLRHTPSRIVLVEKRKLGCNKKQIVRLSFFKILFRPNMIKKIRFGQKLLDFYPKVVKKIRFGQKSFALQL